MGHIPWRELNRKQYEEGLPEDLRDEDGNLLRSYRSVLASKNVIMSDALNDIVNASRDEGLAHMCNWMRGRALAALQEAGELGDSSVP